MDDGPVGEKTKKYDRQLRLWGEHGQQALECAKVCLVNVTATGTELLKNLILPGIGSFTIIDANHVTSEDAGNNFFLDQSSIDMGRAQAATEYLLELNEDVNGDYVEETVENLLDNNPTFFNNFKLVIVTEITERSLLRLANILWENDIPLIICRSCGFIGYLRVVVREHTVIESHPDSALEDLRLDKPFPALVDYCNSLDLENMSKKEHSHTPWLVVIYKYLELWMSKHNGEPPKNYKEKNEFKETIRQGILRNEHNIPEDEENFDEAIRNVNTALLKTRVPDEVLQIFEDDCCVNLHSESKPFWILSRALKEFVQNEGLLPVRGKIPDMTADTERYIQLQKVYRDQCNEDIAVVTRYLQHLLQSLGKDEPLTMPKDKQSPASSPGKPQDNISESDIKLFCKNASFLRVVRCRSLSAEYDPTTININNFTLQSDDVDNDCNLYILLRALFRFQTEYGRYPGVYDETVETDIPKFKSVVTKLMQEFGLSHVIRDEYIHEICRYGGAELHSVAAFMGGTAAQEAIKIITGQFVPLSNTFIYNAMKQTSVSLVV